MRNSINANIQKALVEVSDRFSTTPRGVLSEASLEICAASHLDAGRDSEPVFSRGGKRDSQVSTFSLHSVGLGHSGCHHSSKIHLPLIAYVFQDGPWRDTFVKFGYDPRKDVNARL